MKIFVGVLVLLATTGCSQINKVKEILSPTAPTPVTTTTSGSLGYTAIGASDGIGFGGSAPCVPFTDCPNGTGYVQVLARQLAAGGRPVTHLNLSIPGAVLSRAIEDLASSIGRSVPGNFIDREAPFVPTSTTHVTIFAGGNDANTIGQALRAGAGSADPNAYVDGQVRQWGTDLVDLIARIRARAPSARIVALNLPNLAASPYVASYTPTEKRQMQRIAVGMSDRVNGLTANNVLVVDLLCDARLLLPANYASDGFHPSDSGYAIIAEKTLPPLRDGTAQAPSPTCAQRTIY